jgi:hypothetical protein
VRTEPRTRDGVARVLDAAAWRVERSEFAQACYIRATYTQRIIIHGDTGYIHSKYMFMRRDSAAAAAEIAVATSGVATASAVDSAAAAAALAVGTPSVDGLVCARQMAA